ncbi:MAG: hypothetical protein NPIRA05_00880 [Nitrospirales bacterium]|nr:MAG: hypothetical protein NPIRA05_00880 [Nitrospirales bacterium]
MAPMTKVLIHLPVSLKAKLDSLKAKGYTASGFVRALLEKEFANQPKPTKEGVGK